MLRKRTRNAATAVVLGRLIGVPRRPGDRRLLRNRSPRHDRLPSDHRRHPAAQPAVPVAAVSAARPSSLIGKAGLTPADREDVEQELALRLWQALPGYNPDMGKLRRFVGTVLRRAAHSLLRLRTSRKRGGHCRHQSLPTTSAGGRPPREPCRLPGPRRPRRPRHGLRPGRGPRATPAAPAGAGRGPEVPLLGDRDRPPYGRLRATVHVRIKALRRALKKAGLKFRPEFCTCISRVLRTL